MSISVGGGYSLLTFGLLKGPSVVSGTTIKEALRAFLIADNTISSLISSRVYQGTLPQDATLPAILLTRIAAPGDYNASGSTSMKRATYQVDCWADGRDGADDLADAVNNLINGYRGAMGDVTVHGIFRQDQDDSQLIAAKSAQHSRYRVRLDFDIYYTE